MEKAKIILAITGASGSIYALEFLRLMAGLNVEVHGIISGAGEKVLAIETGLQPEKLKGVAKWYAADDFTAPMASGSARYESMVVLPCTMGTLSAIAHGQSGNLIHRAADVVLKERRRLVLAVRETPFNLTHLKNMVKAHEAGAVICPAIPSFYQKPQSIADLAHDFACRVASLLGYEVAGMKRWQGINA
jgi:4-hydroxy-3-polyprenylbenzoate decarboxylase